LSVRLHKAKREYGSEINIAPLIDVVFLLIIFFLTVSHITQVRVEALSLPEAKEADKSEHLASGRIIINVHENGRIVVSGTTYETDSMEYMLRTEQENPGSGGLSVLLRGDRDTPWAGMSELMQVLTKLGINQISVAVIEPGRSDPELQR
jgi:biopolymer transport protein ExbD